MAGGDGVLRGRPLTGRHITTVGQNHRSPAALPADARRQPVQRSDAARPSRCVVAFELRDAREPPICSVAVLASLPNDHLQIRPFCCAGMPTLTAGPHVQPHCSHYRAHEQKGGKE
jgi:hypothetical protein